MPDWLGILLGGIIGFTTGIIGSLLTGIGCLFGSESGCANFPQYFKAVTFFGPYFLLIVALFFLPTLLRILTRMVSWLLRGLSTGLLQIVMWPLRMIARLPRIIAWLHYFFVPHPGASAVNAARTYRIPGKIDTTAVARAMERDVASDVDPRNLPPAYKSENQRKRAEELQKRMEADRKLFEEIEERERARRRMEKVKRGGE